MLTHRFKHPFSCIITGQSQCRKMTFVKRLIKHQAKMISQVPEVVIWHYSEFQPAYSYLSDKVTFKQGVPSDKQLKTYNVKLLIIDDMMSDMRRYFK